MPFELSNSEVARRPGCTRQTIYNHQFAREDKEAVPTARGGASMKAQLTYERVCSSLEEEELSMSAAPYYSRQ